MKKKIRIKRKYQEGGINYINTNPRITNQFQSEIQSQQQAGQYSTQPSNFNQNMGKVGSIGSNLGTGYYASQAANSTNPGDQTYNATMAGVSKAGPIGGVIGGITAIGDSIAKPIRQKAEKQDAITGAYENEGAAYRGNVAGSMLNPYKTLTTVTNDPYANKTDKTLAYANMILPGISALGMKGYTKRREKGLMREKEVSDWNQSIKNNQMNRQQGYNYLPTFPGGGYVEGEGPLKKTMRPFKDKSTIQGYKDPYSGKTFYPVVGSESNMKRSDVFPFDTDPTGKVLYGTYNPPREKGSVSEFDYVPATFRTYQDDNTTKAFFPNTNLERLYWGVNPYKERSELSNFELMNKYAIGGYHTNNMYGNAELEDEEIFRTPDGEMEKVNGRTHAQGGEIYNLPENTEILGKNKAPNGKSYKKNGDILIKQFNKYNKILENRPTKLAENTALMMLEKIQNKYSDLMDMQEIEKNNLNNNTMEYAKGGWIQKAINPKHKGYCTPMTKSTCTPHRKALAKRFKSGDLSMHPYGGYPTNKPTNRNTYITNFQNREFLDNEDVRLSNKFFNPDEFRDVIETREAAPKPLLPRGFDERGNLLGLKSKNTLPYLPEYTPYNANNFDNSRILESNTFANRSLDKSPDKWYNKTIDTAGQYAPIAYNLYQGMFSKPERMNSEDYQNPYENQAMSLMRKRRYNIEPELEANRLSTADYYRNLRQGAPSQGRYLSGLQSGQIGKQRADAEAYARKQNMDNQYIGEEAGMLGGFGQQRASTKYNIENINAANRSAQKKYIPTALSQLQEQTQMNKLMKEKKRLMQNKALRDEQRQRIMEEYFKGYNFNLGGI